ncbi:MAG: class I SAM-dependent methyltransferase [Pseudomonadota bacterium]
MTSHVYRDQYYDYIDDGSSRSAARIIARIQQELNIGSVLDVGCGRGAWLSEWSRAGASEFHGVDGEYVEIDKLPFEAAHFSPADLTNPLDLNRRFDLVQSVEVAEHLDEKYAEQFVDTLTRHGDVIMFSAATPGQGGEHHVNEQPLDYWRAKFAARGYDCYDFIRPQIKDDANVEPWYRFNLLFYIRNGHAAGETLSHWRLDDDEAPPTLAPLWWRARNAFLSVFGPDSIDRLARLKHAMHRTLKRA